MGSSDFVKPDKRGIPLNIAQSAVEGILSNYGLNITNKEYTGDDVPVSKHKYILEDGTPLSWIHLRGDNETVKGIEIFSKILGDIYRNMPTLLDIYKEELEKIGFAQSQIPKYSDFIYIANREFETCIPEEATGKDLESFLEEACSLLTELQEEYNAYNEK